jgi:hypothetical protein
VDHRAPTANTAHPNNISFRHMKDFIKETLSLDVVN